MNSKHARSDEDFLRLPDSFHIVFLPSKYVSDNRKKIIDHLSEILSASAAVFFADFKIEKSTVRSESYL